jgi:hypothetical protein
MDPLTLSGIFSVATKLIDRLFPDKLAADAAKLELVKLQMNGELALLAADTELAKGQMEINKQEAAHRTVFVAGWRPSIGWICSAGLAYQFVLLPILSWVALAQGIPVPPPIELSALIPLLMGMLGLGGLRTYEKKNGIAK